ncbi:MAG TPA: type II secretion system F family protein [Polyangiaceae bacterium]|nr:type II secretion system F family protein [Polyangiaceae bacterium]
MQHSDWFRLLSCTTVASSVFVLTYVAASAESGHGTRLGLRGLKRQRALESAPGWALLEPVVRWLGARCSGLVSPEFREKANRKLSLAGDYLGLLPEEAVALSVLSAFGGLLLGYVLGALAGLGDLVLISGTLLGAASPYFRISSTAGTRMMRVNRRLPHAIDLLALSMSAGLDFPGSVRQLVEKSGSPDDPLVEEFTLMLQSLQLGRTRRQALEEFAARAPTDAVVEFVAAVVQAELRGNPLVDVLRIQAEVSRRKRTVRAEESAAKAGVAMAGPLILVFLTILILIVAPIVMKLQTSNV